MSLLLPILAACNPGPQTTPMAETVVASPLPSDTPAPPTPTSAPLAVRVNGEGILLSVFDSELKRLQASGSTLSETEQRQTVIDQLVDEALLVQAAQKAGHTVSDEDLQQRLADLTARAGGEAALAAWLQSNHYDADTFRAALRRAMLAAWQRDQITAAVPEEAEQVHARQILVFDADLAQQIYQTLQTGADFATQAFRYDAQTGGELGWFPRGYLVQPEVEEAAFALQPGEYSPVIKSAIGWHIVQVIDRNPARKLSPDALQTLQMRALQEWLTQQRAAADIEILLP